MGELTLILGGARSGKSSFAERLAGQQNDQVVYIATAESLDEEMKTRIQSHKNKRPSHWITMEIPRQVGQTMLEQTAQSGVIILDCLTLLVSNLILEGINPNEELDKARATRAVEAELDVLLVAINSGRAKWIVVSNEVGMGLVPPYPLGRLYRDLLGRANMRLAEQACEIYLMIAGIPLPIHHIKAIP